jgi:hypothetical protein
MSTNVINPWHGDLWSIGISNIPTVDNISELYIFEQFVRSIAFPEYGIEIDESQFNGYKILHPIAPKANINLTLLQIEFKISENFENYLYLWKWLYNLRHGEVSTELLRKYWIESIYINILDNQKRLTGKFQFSHCFIQNLSSLPMNYGRADEIFFNASFNYEKIDWIQNE